jgi:hypothetical protein
MAMPFDTLQSCAVQLPGSRMRESRCSLLGTSSVHIATTGQCWGEVCRLPCSEESHSIIDDETLAAASLSHFEATGKRKPAWIFQISRSPKLGIAS